ncbi:MAG: hypothetical protein OD817_02955 [Gammaproteobacteria bacterium]
MAIERRAFLLGAGGGIAAALLGFAAGAKRRFAPVRAAAAPRPAAITTYKPRAGGWFLSDAQVVDGIPGQ